jgi:hypothetical protein
MTVAEAQRQYQVALENARSAREMAESFVSFIPDAEQAEDEVTGAFRQLQEVYMVHKERVL